MPRASTKNQSLQRRPNASLGVAIAVMAVVVAVAGYAVVASSHAAASTFKICNTYTQGCLVSNGPGQIVTAGSGGAKGQAIWREIPVGTTYEFENASGNCLSVKDSVNQTGGHDAIMVGGACNFTNNNERWMVSQGTNQMTFTNYYYGCKLHEPIEFANYVNVDCSSLTSGAEGWVYKLVNP